jgi:hypothetical protein
LQPDSPPAARTWSTRFRRPLRALEGPGTGRDSPCLRATDDAHRGRRRGASRHASGRGDAWSRRRRPSGPLF